MATKTPIDNPATVDNSELFKSKMLADVVFVLRQDASRIEILAHKVILALNCKYFEKVFSEGLKDKYKPEILISNMPQEAFNSFLKFFYLKKFELEAKHIGYVLKLMVLYQVNEFLPKCEEIFQNIAISTNVQQYYELAVTLNLSAKLRASLEDIIGRNPMMALQQCTNPTHTLQTIKFKCDEFDIFLGLMAWATKSLQQKRKPLTVENIKLEIGESLYEIRFPTMALPQFITCVERFPHLIEYKEHLDILHYITSARMLKSAKRFSTVPRSNTNYMFAHAPERAKDRQLTYGKAKITKCELIHDVFTTEQFEKSGTLIRLILHSFLSLPKLIATKLTIKYQNTAIFSQDVNFEKNDDPTETKSHVYEFSGGLPIIENKLYTFQFGNGVSARSNSINGTHTHVFYFGS